MRWIILSILLIPCEARGQEFHLWNLNFIGSSNISNISNSGEQLKNFIINKSYGIAHTTYIIHGPYTLDIGPTCFLNTSIINASINRLRAQQNLGVTSLNIYYLPQLGGKSNCTGGGIAIGTNSYIVKPAVTTTLAMNMLGLNQPNAFNCISAGCALSFNADPISILVTSKIRNNSLNAVERHQLFWLFYTEFNGNGDYVLRDIELFGDALIVPIVSDPLFPIRNVFDRIIVQRTDRGFIFHTIASESPNTYYALDTDRIGLGLDFFLESGKIVTYGNAVFTAINTNVIRIAVLN